MTVHLVMARVLKYIQINTTLFLVYTKAEICSYKFRRDFLLNIAGVRLKSVDMAKLKFFT